MSRYLVTHPDRVAAMVISGPGSFTYPDADKDWPPGMGVLNNEDDESSWWWAPDIDGDGDRERFGPDGPGPDSVYDADEDEDPAGRRDYYFTPEPTRYKRAAQLPVMALAGEWEDKKNIFDDDDPDTTWSPPSRRTNNYHTSLVYNVMMWVSKMREYAGLEEYDGLSTNSSAPVNYYDFCDYDPDDPIDGGDFELCDNGEEGAYIFFDENNELGEPGDFIYFEHSGISHDHNILLKDLLDDPEDILREYEEFSNWNPVDVNPFNENGDPDEFEGVFSVILENVGHNGRSFPEIVYPFFLENKPQKFSQDWLNSTMLPLF